MYTFVDGMKIKPSLTFKIFVLSVLAAAFGCMEKPAPLKPMEEVKTEAAQMTLEELKQAAKEHVLKIMEKKRPLSQLETEYKALSQTAPAGAKLQKLNEQLGRLRSEINGRAMRYHVYRARIEEQGGVAPKIRDFERGNG